ncbi:MAG: B12-binding domain-containing protein [Terracidiphilus sp.]|jgi:methanogenic corrinoid protein MtbC1
MVQSIDLYDAIFNGDAKKAHVATQATLAAGVAPLQMISESMVPAMDEVGRLFEVEEYFVPELLLAGRAMRSALELLRPLIAFTPVATPRYAEPKFYFYPLASLHCPGSSM